jgi:cytochrome c oxidase assembly protein subunit 15
MGTVRAAARRTFRDSVSRARFQQLAALTVVALFVVVVSGAVVRLTDSGLGCDNWPSCGETPLPEQNFHAAVEFGNRMVALVGIIIAIVTAVASTRVRCLRGPIVVASVAAAVGVVAQIPLGGLTVILDLHPVAVMSHFMLALVVIGLAVYVAVRAREQSSAQPSQRQSEAAPSVELRFLVWLAIALVPVAAVLVVTGAVVTASGPHPGGDGVQRLGDFWSVLRVHVWVSGAFGIAYGVLLIGLWRFRGLAARELQLSVGVLAVLVTQLIIGEVQKENGLPWELVLAHVALATLVWSGMVALAASLSSKATLKLRP